MPKSKKEKESKTIRLTTISRNIRSLQEKLDEYGKRIDDLTAQYQNEVDSQPVYAKWTGKELSKIYEKQAAATTELEQMEALYEVVAAESESSSDESRRSGDSRRSGRSGKSGSSKSSKPATIGWDCGNCGVSNFTDPGGPVSVCGCGHRFCEAEFEVQVSAGYDRDGIEIFRTQQVDHCSVQWDPE